jgi:hypothetical protein
MEIIIDNTYKCEWDIPARAWDTFCENAFDTESDTQNFKLPFAKMTKKFGRQYMEYCRASWVTCKDFMTPEEFCKMNGNMPIGFFKNKIAEW